MTEIDTNLFVGTTEEVIPVFLLPEEWAIVNTTSTLHATLHGWKKAMPLHPCYVIHQENQIFSLNWVDAAKEYFDYQGKGVENILLMLNFIKTQLKEGKKVFLCCDKGKSRSPSVGLLYLAAMDKLPNETYEKAKFAFMQLYPGYQPSEGIRQFLTEKWGDFIYE